MRPGVMPGRCVEIKLKYVDRQQVVLTKKWVPPAGNQQPELHLNN